MGINDKGVPDSVKVYLKPPEITKRKTTYRIKAKDFITNQLFDEDGDKPADYLIIGFDTEFKTPDYHLTRDQIELGKAKYRVLSYQFSARFPDGTAWDGICCTEEDERMSLAEFIVFALGAGVQTGRIPKFPKIIYLVGHFTRADIPAFADFKDQANYLSSVRNTFINIDKSLPIRISHEDGEVSLLNVMIRDTMLLTPQSSKSLRALGDMLKMPKLMLDADTKTHKYLISNMHLARVERWESYRAYAIMDAEICARYAEKIISEYKKITGKTKLPVTLTSIGVDLLLKKWVEDLKIPRLEVIGKQEVKTRVYQKSKGYYRTVKEEVDLEILSHYMPLFTECYHGGRNEQYWFGPGVEGEWIDIDLASAYPTAMSIITKPKWERAKDSTNVADFKPTTLGFAWVEFKYPKGTRFPSLPIRTENGIIFPLEGESYCAAPEIFAAVNQGCKIKIKRGVIIPTDQSIHIFKGFIAECLQKRKSVGSKTLEGLFWKEISNSTYGKTAQGLRKKRIYDMRERDTKPLPPSRITNPCYAAYITSFVRALIGEILNSIPQDYEVFSCTTDGFLTNFPEKSIASVKKGPLARIYEKARSELTGQREIIEIKHAIAQPLGWRTRGQATLKQHPHLEGEEKGILLAKGGIFTKPEAESTLDKNREVVDLFWSRTPESMIVVHSFTGIRDMIEHDADLVTKDIYKRLSMEYDWKRKPTYVDHSTEFEHIYFSTAPWNSKDEFESVRKAWTDYTKRGLKVIKQEADLRGFLDYVNCVAIDSEAAKYMRKMDPDITRLRQSLCSAWHRKVGGFEEAPKLTANQFASVLNGIGIQCKRTDVENGKKKEFIGKNCPATKRVIDALKGLKQHFPELQPSVFLIPSVKGPLGSIRFS